MPTTTDKVIKLVRKAGVLRPRDLDRYGIARTYLARLERRGVIRRVGRGLYIATLADAELSEHQSITEACKRVPKGVVCLLSALRFHEVTTQNPFEVWMAIDFKSRRPKVSYPPLRIVRFSGPALVKGVERHRIKGAAVRVYSVAKTIADCFKYRNKIGLDVAIEAMQEGFRGRRTTVDEVWRYAETCRVQKVMRPYLEVLSR